MIITRVMITITIAITMIDLHYKHDSNHTNLTTRNTTTSAIMKLSQSQPPP